MQAFLKGLLLKHLIDWAKIQLKKIQPYAVYREQGAGQKLMDTLQIPVFLIYNSVSNWIKWGFEKCLVLKWESCENAFFWHVALHG